MIVPTKTPRLAIAQIPMYWEMSDNVSAMKSALQIARDEGASLCAFAELAVTGFHRRIVDWAKPEVSEPAVNEVCMTAASLGIATAFGAPTYGVDGTRFNTHLFVGADGALIGKVSKIGLTAPEATFFTPGTDRPTFHINGVKFSAVICREIEDGDQVLPQLAGTGVDVILWPGQMRPDPEKPPQDPPAHVVQAQDLARRSSTYIVQTNWPNALNRPEESKDAGHSACIAPSGEILFRLPSEGYGIAVFNLGEPGYDWHASGT
ncbi:MAG: carbon-nitrogen hydrolase family protein [Burkholderiales bacterium]